MGMDRNAIRWGSIALMHVKLGVLEIRMVENQCLTIISYGGPWRMFSNGGPRADKCQFVGPWHDKV